jgi:CRP-like cAMP-binding protein
MRRGEVLMRTGEPGRFMMIVTQGEVRVQLTSEAGQIQVLKISGPGTVIGEIALFDGQTRTADVVAATHGRAAVIERAAVLRLLAQDSQFALSVIAGLCGRLRETLGQLEAMAFQDVATRLAACLLRLAVGAKPRRLDITQEQLGRLVGASREIVNKRLRALASEGVLQLAPGRIVLQDEARLAAMAAAGAAPAGAGPEGRPD